MRAKIQDLCIGHIFQWSNSISFYYTRSRGRPNVEFMINQAPLVSNIGERFHTRRAQNSICFTLHRPTKTTTFSLVFGSIIGPFMINFRTILRLISFQVQFLKDFLRLLGLFRASFGTSFVQFLFIQGSFWVYRNSFSVPY